MHENSVIKAVQTLFPEYNLKSKPKPEPLTEEQRGDIIKSIEKSLGITKPEDWYKIHLQQIKELGGAKVLYH
jgi:hypothetical protein